MIRKSKPTGGDWYLSPSDSDYSGQLIMSNREAFGRAIAQTVTKDSCRETAEEKANARLLVAAPKLRDALRDLLDAYAGTGAFACECVSGAPKGHCQFCIARDALKDL